MFVIGKEFEARTFSRQNHIINEWDCLASLFNAEQKLEKLYIENEHRRNTAMKNDGFLPIKLVKKYGMPDAGKKEGLFELGSYGWAPKQY